MAQSDDMNEPWPDRDVTDAETLPPGLVRLPWGTGARHDGPNLKRLKKRPLTTLHQLCTTVHNIS